MQQLKGKKSDLSTENTGTLKILLNEKKSQDDTCVLHVHKFGKNTKQHHTSFTDTHIWFPKH